MGAHRLAVALTLPVIGGALVVPLIGGASAVASPSITSPVSVATSNWFWNKSVAVPAQVTSLLPVPVPIPPEDAPLPDGVLIPAGDLAVSYRDDPNGEPDRETYLTFTLGGAQPNSTVDSFTFTLTVDKNNPANIDPGGVALIACFPSRAWDKGSGGASFSAKPGDICDPNAQPAKYDAAKNAYTFQVAPFAQDWVNGSNIGVAIRQAKSQTAPFTLAFTGPKTVTGSIAYEPPTTSTSGGTVTVPTNPVTPVVTAPDAGTTAATGSEPVAQPPAVPTAPMPGVTVAPNTFTPAGGTHAIGATTFDRRFWVSTAIGVLGVALLAFFVGRRPVAAVAAPKQMSRLSQVLAARAQ